MEEITKKNKTRKHLKHIVKPYDKPEHILNIILYKALTIKFFLLKLYLTKGSIKSDTGLVILFYDCLVVVVVVVVVCMMLSKGIVALFSTAGRPVVPFVHMQTGTTFGMPYVTTGPSVNSSSLAFRMTANITGDETGSVTGSVTDSGNLSLHIRPLIHGAMLAVIHRHRWTVVYYLYDSDHGMFCTRFDSGASTTLQGSHASWKVLYFFLDFPGPGKSWKISLVLESPGNESLRSWKVLENEDPG